MKAVVIHKYGGNEVVQIEDMPLPEPGPGDVLIRVHAASVNPVDWKIRYGQLRIFTGGRFPRILGRECAGEVVETGGAVTKFKKGDRVIGLPAIRSMGCFAEYACVPETAAFPKPENASFEEAASIPIAGLTALQALRDRGKIAAGKAVLINGASGGVGHFAVQIAKIFGAEVTAVCSGANADFVKGLGAGRVIDYRREDFTKEGKRYDIVFDAVAKRSFGECRKVLAPGGVYVSTLPALSIIVSTLLAGFPGGRKARMINVAVNAADMEWMRLQVEAGEIGIVIEKVFPLDQAKEALAYSETGRVRGKIVLKAV